MYAVINEEGAILRTCKTKEAAIIAAELERDKAPIQERRSITAVAMDDGGFTDIRF